MGRGCFCGSAPGVVVVGSCVPRMFSCFYPVAGVTLWPFIFVSPDVPEDEMAVMVKCDASSPLPQPPCQPLSPLPLPTPALKRGTALGPLPPRPLSHPPHSC